MATPALIKLVAIAMPRHPSPRNCFPYFIMWFLLADGWNFAGTLRRKHWLLSLAYDASGE
jgi:hypothetical protein